MQMSVRGWGMFAHRSFSPLRVVARSDKQTGVACRAPSADAVCAALYKMIRKIVVIMFRRRIWLKAVFGRASVSLSEPWR